MFFCKMGLGMWLDREDRKYFLAVREGNFRVLDVEVVEVITHHRHQSMDTEFLIVRDMSGNRYKEQVVPVMSGFSKIRTGLLVSVSHIDDEVEKKRWHQFFVRKLKVNKKMNTQRVVPWGDEGVLEMGLKNYWKYMKK